MFSNASNYVQGVDTAFVIILSVIFFFLIALTAVLLFFLFKYRVSRNPKPTHIEGNNTLEIIWTVIPLILVLAMFWFGWIGWKPMEAQPPKDSFWIETSARMWKWDFKYPNGKRTDTLYVPQGKAIALDLKAQDVIHSLYIPAFRLKKDMVPGTDRNAWFIANSPGSYDLFCTEYCGLQHSSMITTVKVLPQAEFDSWYADSSGTILAEITKEISPAMVGKQIIQRVGCNACHSVDGSKIIGPTYLGLFGKQETVITNGKERVITVDEEYIRRSILDPNADVVKGFVKGQMINYKDQLSEDEITALIEYIRTIQ